MAIILAQILAKMRADKTSVARWIWPLARLHSIIPAPFRYISVSNQGDTPGRGSR
jgi:hypothetical protein